MSEMGIDQVLAQMRAMSSMAQAGMAPPAQVDNSERPDFAGLLQDSVSKVNETQQTSSKLQAAFESEDPNVELAEVMVAMQKSSLSFQAMTTVRNKLVSAYQEIMSMPV
ncbi:MAG: flagellar hook-basal body complex protein FliE [Gammaproteobacteria bacterium]|nr:flagellar hook-basal body complex protein FliE [Gammaproteobacteria bacterium]